MKKYVFLVAMLISINTGYANAMTALECYNTPPKDAVFWGLTCADLCLQETQDTTLEDWIATNLTPYLNKDNDSDSDGPNDTWEKNRAKLDDIINGNCFDNNNNGTMDGEEDSDGDGIKNSKDNCPDIANKDQADEDGDGIGDACETKDTDDDDSDTDTDNDDSDIDTDDDGILDDVDNCPTTANADQADDDNNDIGNMCEPNINIASPGGGDCSLNPSATASGIGWIFDLAIFAAPLIGFSTIRRKK